MNEQLKTVLEYIKNEYSSKALTGARNYLNVNIGKVALNLGFTALHDAYADREVIVSLKDPVPGMKVRIDGRTFVNYAEYSDGFAVPSHIAKKAGLPIKPYIANDSMILNFA
ncbi:hypothetical protein [Desulfobacula sp.]|uniref:hypothetical protein n=1 Tax=Desulfobacula sp. TaxID=2593537 RepID=UPI0026184876|nr:hypothetical protein [Desulfobacula sp.]